MIELLILLIGPAAGGALLYRLWNTRPPCITHTGLAVGQIPVNRRRRRAMAVRREVSHG
ncbi:hypothetical protein LPH50_07850 [Xylella taiwanensis]|uniref:Uncharacterized protein n=1 Tax=Xylella taiwanensis TaxID=1444770 RepID=A0ABS8TXG9_9GAMM|nr:hypothetical protein [Xylella taiwanensis]MCD8455862.1 hypothetical protein [Xylella taiwanensis]MCD8458266.1 hypothetical protein [Xylella taiwanensis]MCD8460403.1 hypothetical protein [Xylella taiwanensis]MCD8463538.1 hypothetical protein [Xylella taiwanensis]MCD8464905.1 hypothetical protein [Xylella taiwanensis]